MEYMSHLLPEDCCTKSAARRSHKKCELLNPQAFLGCGTRAERTNGQAKELFISNTD